MTKSKLQLILFIISAVLVVTAIILMFSSPTPQSNTQKAYTLRAVDGVVTLFYGESAINTYSDISVSNLPFEDRAALEKGIEFKTQTEAELAAEDYDG